MRIAIIDYGMGNIGSLIGALRFVGCKDIVVADSSKDILSADKIILPGVGNYATATEQIKAKQLDILLKEFVLGYKKPILGICLGMQLMGQTSTESGLHYGLGFVDADVEAFPRAKVKVPHVGYDQVEIAEGSRLFRGLGGTADFYFIHSYRMTCAARIGQSICIYGDEFVAGFEIDNISGVQFHPELSQTNGLRLLRNFIEIQ